MILERHDWWQPQVHGGPNSPHFEISVVNANQIDKCQREGYGWFDENKLLISHNGGPCHWPVNEFVWGLLLAVASETANHMNSHQIHHEKEDVK